MTKEIKHPETIALHGGEYRSDPATTAVAVPIYRTTSYQFKDTDTAANRPTIAFSASIKSQLFFISSFLIKLVIVICA